MKKKLKERKSPLINLEEEELEETSSTILNEVPLENITFSPTFSKRFSGHFNLSEGKQYFLNAYLPEHVQSYKSHINFLYPQHGFLLVLIFFPPYTFLVEAKLK